MGFFRDCFEELEDPRPGNATRHDLLEVLKMAITASICGAESCVDFAEAREGLFRRFLRLENGLPSHDTFSRLFRRLDPAAFSECFARFMDGFAAAARGEGVVAIDGKTLRRSFDKASGASPLHMVSAYSSAARMVLGQQGVPGKSNEIPAVRALIALLDLDGAVVTADAMHCDLAVAIDRQRSQRETAQAIRDKGADYVLALKGNQGGIEADVELFLADQATRPDDVAETTDADHGRIEVRRAAVYAAPWLAEAHHFPGVAAIGVVESTRENGAGATSARRLFPLSKFMSAAAFLAIARAHWSIENGLRWVLDVTFDEDRTRNRKDNGPQNLAIVRHLALNLLRKSSLDRSIRRKIKLAGWDDAFLVQTLTQMR